MEGLANNNDYEGFALNDAPPHSDDDASIVNHTPIHAIPHEVVQPNIGAGSEAEPNIISISPPIGKRSEVWKHYNVAKTILGNYACCKYCKKLTQNASGRTGTSNLSRHLERCDAYKVSSRMPVEFSVTEFDQKTYCKLFAKAILLHGYSLNMVEHEGLRELHTYLNPNVKNISRNTILKWCMLEHNQLKQYVRDTLNALSSKICLTCDMWTACNSHAYLTLTAHFVDNNWVLRSKVLNFRHFPPPHTGDEIFTLIDTLIKEWGIERKVCCMTVDNASNMDNMVGKLRGKLDRIVKLPFDGKYFHVRCAAHILNLIVKEGLAVINESVVKLRENVKYIDSSEARLLRFEECASHFHLPLKCKLWLDVPTRWNSTYLMLRRALDFMPAIKMFGDQEANYQLVLSNYDWDVVEKLCSFLEPFYNITVLFSGSEYPTSNLYFANICKIQSLLMEASTGDDEKLKEMATRMRVKFDKYWADHSALLSFAAILDPRLKFQFLRHTFNELYDPVVAEAKVQEIYCEFTSLYNYYKEPIPSYSSQDSSSSVEVHSFQQTGVYASYDAVIASSNSGKSELELYLELPVKHRNPDEEFDILGFWKDMSVSFPTLGRIAKDLLAIPISTVASESSFSMGGRILNKIRSSLLSRHVKAFMTTQNWLFGYGEFEIYGIEVLRDSDGEADASPSP